MNVCVAAARVMRVKDRKERSSPDHSTPTTIYILFMGLFLDTDLDSKD